MPRLSIYLVSACAAAACVRPLAHWSNRVAVTVPAPLRPDDEAGIIAAVTELLPRATAPVPLCLRLRDSASVIDLPEQTLAALGPRIVSHRQCPPTYAAPVQTPDTKPRPAGYIDPYKLDAWRPRTDARGIFLNAELWQGTGFTRFRCDLTRSGLAWKASCRETGRGFA